jgi:protein gp37
MNRTSIEWTHRPETGGVAGGFTWNPIRARINNWQEISGRECDCPCERCDERGNGHCGNKPCDQPRTKPGTFCTRISPGCTNCYASVINKRFGNGLEYTVSNLEKVEFYIDEKILAEPLKRKKPATIFVGDMFDLFHEAIPIELLDYVWSAMAVCKNHTFQVLTKRADRMHEYLRQIQDDEKDMHRWQALACEITDSPCAAGLIEDLPWPLPNVWLGVSVESQKYADERIPLLLQTPAAVRFLSVEPMLEAVDLDSESADHVHALGCGESDHHVLQMCRGVDWVICGGESGPGARPMHPDWARSLRDQCIDANVAFFFKQWGEWMPHAEPPDPNGSYHGGIFLQPNRHIGNQGDWWSGRAQAMDRVGKNKAGHLLDGKEWLQFPTIAEKLVTA